MGKMASGREIGRALASNLTLACGEFDYKFAFIGLDPRLLGAEFSIFRIRVLRAKFVRGASQIY